MAPPEPEGTAATFLDAWEKGDYAGMYSLLTALSQAAFSKEDFTKRYQSVAEAATVRSVEAEILSSLKTGNTAHVAYQVTLHTALVGDIVRETEMQLHFESGHWQVAWIDAMIVPELAGGNTLVMEYTIPARANLYDRNGLALAAQGDAVAIGVVPGEITDEEGLLRALSDLLDIRPEVIQQKLVGQLPDWYVPLGEVSKEAWDKSAAHFANLGGWRASTYHTRFYPFGGVAPQVVGYTAFIPKEELADYQARGYRGDEKVGLAGLEKWGEPYLAGVRGGTLYVVTPEKQIVGKLAESQPQPAQAIYTTLDRDLQVAVQAALGDFNGAIVVLNPQTGEVLAMVSSPTYDPNLFDPTNTNFILLDQVLANRNQPLFNRATQGQYPLGSVFKIPMMAAAMTSGRYTPETTYNCGHYWDELGPTAVKVDWTLEAGLPPQGVISLERALVVSCDTYFYHVGLDLYNFDPNLAPEAARAFGLGQATGIDAVAEATGLIPDPAWKQSALGQPWEPGDSVNMAIGQGYVLVTPLQVAMMMGAVRNGGTLYRPQIIQSIAAPGATPVFEFKPEAVGQLPITSDQLSAIQEALHAVTSEKGGTARHRFLGLYIPVAGKTGTAEDPGHPSGLPHSWF
ncbi:MAG: penicillin-binding transpeptidase domain-containing protein, partial [Anaerolineales bacterium]